MASITFRAILPDDFHIKNYENNIPDILDEALWGTLAWEYLQNDDGSIQFGTETRGYPEPYAAPLDLDKKKYGTVKVDDRAVSIGAGLFMHLARVIKPYQPEHSAELVKRAEKAKALLAREWQFRNNYTIIFSVICC